MIPLIGTISGCSTACCWKRSVNLPGRTHTTDPISGGVLVGDYKEGGTKMTPKRIALLVCIVLFAAFIVQNAQVVEVRFLFWKTEASRALVLLGTLILGLISGWLFGRLRGKRPHPPLEE